MSDFILRSPHPNVIDIEIKNLKLKLFIDFVPGF